MKRNGKWMCEHLKLWNCFPDLRSLEFKCTGFFAHTRVIEVPSFSNGMQLRRSSKWITRSVCVFKCESRKWPESVYKFKIFYLTFVCATERRTSRLRHRACVIRFSFRVLCNTFNYWHWAFKLNGLSYQTAYSVNRLKSLRFEIVFQGLTGFFSRILVESLFLIGRIRWIDWATRLRASFSTH